MIAHNLHHTSRPGERLKRLVWTMTLFPGGALPVPTVERVNELRRLVLSWLQEDQAGDDQDT